MDLKSGKIILLYIVMSLTIISVFPPLFSQTSKDRISNTSTNLTVTTVTNMEGDWPSNNNIIPILRKNRINDLRHFFISSNKVNELVTQTNCLVIEHNTTLEVSIPDGVITLDKLIYALFRHKYDGQLRVVHRDSIVQTPIVEYNPSLQTVISVDPGDIVIILGHD